MDLTLTRFLVRADGIFSRLLNPQGETLAVTLEHAFGNSQSGYGAKLPIGHIFGAPPGLTDGRGNRFYAASFNLTHA